MPSPRSLVLEGFGLAYRDRIVLADVSFSLPERGVTVLMGPPGCGKSSLLRTLSGHQAANPGLRTWGTARLDGVELAGGPRPALVGQSARQMLATVFDNLVLHLPQRHTLTRLEQRETVERALRDDGLDVLVEAFDRPAAALPRCEQRLLAVAREELAGHPLLFVDEPTTDLSDADADRLLAHLRHASIRRPVLLVLHRRDQVRQVADRVIVIGGGRVLDDGPSARVLDAPAHAEAARFLETGYCRLPAPDAAPESLDDDVPAPPPVPRAALAGTREAAGPRGFLWLEQGRLAGTPRPGVINSVDYDLAAIRLTGITVLISLTEDPLERAAAERHGLRLEHFPIPDMGTPEIDACIALCEHIGRMLDDGQRVAVHCQAGLGRTGTVLAAYLIRRGASCLEALDTVGRIERQWPQSAAQFAFLEKFAAAVDERCTI